MDLPEHIESTQKTNYTPVIVLGIAAILLLIVGFISYRDFVGAETDKQLAEYSDKIKELEDRIDRQEVVEAAQPTSPEIEELRRQLDEMKQKTESNSLKVDRILDSGPPVAAAPAPAATASGSDSLFGPIPEGILNPDSLASGNRQGSLTVQPNSEPTNPATNYGAGAPSGLNGGNGRFGFRTGHPREISELEKRIHTAPPIGKVIGYDENWALVTIGAGQANGLVRGQRYSVRRGTEILGTVKIKEVAQSESMAELITKNRDFDGALKPQVGDDIILAESF